MVTTKRVENFCILFFFVFLNVKLRIDMDWNCDTFFCFFLTRKLFVGVCFLNETNWKEMQMKSKEKETTGNHNCFCFVLCFFCFPCDLATTLCFDLFFNTIINTSDCADEMFCRLLSFFIDNDFDCFTC